MDDFLGADWIAVLGSRANAVEIDTDLRLSLEHRITDEPPTTWHVDLRDGRVRIGAGPHPDPTLTVATSRAVATSIHRGELSAQRAFLDGNLRIGGDIAVLLAHRQTLERLAATLAAT